MLSFGGAEGSVGSLPSSTWPQPNRKTLEPPKPRDMTPTKADVILYSRHSVTKAQGVSKASMCGLTCLRCKFGVMLPHCKEYKLLTNAAKAPTSTWLPTELFMPVIGRGSSMSSLRNARTNDPTSTASASKVPAMCPSMPSTSQGEMLAFRRASAMASCSAGPCGAANAAPTPLLFIIAPAMEPIRGSSSWLKTCPSTTVFRHLTPAAATPSQRVYPSAVASKDKQRPRRESQPEAHCEGHQRGVSRRCAAMATLMSLAAARPFFWQDSAAK
mmetsp:Transcript_77341/g.196503  ORF Transcript_77341/g.196503 Transcript_77341/m.196503 type:complete len:272 (+) Transcript_77341:855-1670(+)